MKSIIPTKTALAQELSIDAAYSGQRLDNFLLRELRGAPRTLIYRIIRSGEVRLNGKRVKAETRVQAADSLRLPPLRLAPQALTDERRLHAPAKSFPLLYDDAYFCAINKPAGVAVHGGSGVAFGVIEQLRSSWPHEKTLELVHRLDRETSGLLLIAKRMSALRALQAAFRERQVHKEYLTLVLGDWPVARKGIDLPLMKYLDAQGERRVRTLAKDHPDSAHAMSALTLVRKIGSFSLAHAGVCSLLAVRIKTGRTHQIRVHTQAVGHAIVGDEKYGDFALNKQLRPQLPRMFLHAWRLQLTHPSSGADLQLCAPLPAELRQVLPLGLQTELDALERVGWPATPESPVAP